MPQRPRQARAQGCPSKAEQRSEREDVQLKLLKKEIQLSICLSGEKKAPKLSAGWGLSMAPAAEVTPAQPFPLCPICGD